MWTSLFYLATLLLSSWPLVASQASVLDAGPYTFIDDDQFNFFFLSKLATVRNRGGLLPDYLSAAQFIEPLNMTSFNMTFYQLAERTRQIAESTADPVSAQDYYFAAANYYRAADFYLHANWTDPHIMSYFDLQTTCFNNAIAGLPAPGQRVTIPADGFDTIGIFYAVDNSSQARPTILIGNGYDGWQEDTGPTRRTTPPG